MHRVPLRLPRKGLLLGLLTAMSSVALATAEAQQRGWAAPRATPNHQRESQSRNDIVHFETMGNAGLYSLNYTRVLWRDIAARVGISYIGLGGGLFVAEARASVLTMPLLVHYLGLGSRVHRLDLAAGTLLVYASAEAQALNRTIDGGKATVAGTASIGYRLLAPGGFTLNLGFTPIFGRRVFLPWGGAGVGYAF